MNGSERQNKHLVAIASVVCLGLAIVGFILLGLSWEGKENSTTSEVSRMQKMAGQVQEMEKEVQEKEGQVAELAEQYERQKGDKVPLSLDTSGLGREERELLEQKIAAEEDVSLRALLREIVKKGGEIDTLKNLIAETESMLPRPHIAREGESHYKIAMDFLVLEKGLDKEEAAKILARTALFEELAQGFKVWSFYTGTEFGTAVTQGEAEVSPGAFVHRAKRRLREDRDNALAERDRMAENMEYLTQDQDKTLTMLEQVTCEKDELKTTVEALSEKAYSMFYRLDSQRKLKKDGILKGGFLSPTRLKDVAPEHFDRRLDLSYDDRLTIVASELGVDKIEDVVLYPKVYKKGSNYKVLITTNKKYALVTIVDKEIFNSQRVAIAVK